MGKKTFIMSTYAIFATHLCRTVIAACRCITIKTLDEYLSLPISSDTIIERAECEFVERKVLTMCFNFNSTVTAYQHREQEFIIRTPSSALFKFPVTPHRALFENRIEFACTLSVSKFLKIEIEYPGTVGRTDRFSNRIEALREYLWSLELS